MAGTSKAILAKLFPSKLSKGERTKLRMIEAAIQCLGTSGIEGLTFEAVGKRVGMNRAQVKYHFKDRTELLNRAIEYSILNGQEMLVEKVKRASGWRAQALAVVEGMFDWLEAYPDQGRVFLYFQYASTYSKRYRRLQERLGGMATVRLSEILKQGKQEMNWSSATVTNRTESIWALAEGFMVYGLSRTNELGIPYYRKHLISAVKRELS